MARPALLVSLDVDRDAALLYSASVAGIVPLPFRASSSLHPGERVLALGHPEGLEFSVSDGVVSAVREVSGLRLVQTTAPISHGSSGGPLIDARGNVIGMTTMYLSSGQNLNFAVSVEVLGELRPPAVRWLRTALPASRTAAASSIEKSNPLPAIVSGRSAAGLGRAYRKAKSPVAARAVIEKGLELFPDNEELLLEAAELNWDARRFEDSRSFVTRLLEINPKSAEGHQCLSAEFVREKKFKEARSEAETSLSLKPNPEYEADANDVLANCDIADGDIVSAVAHVRKAMTSEAYSGRFMTHVRYALLLQTINRLRDADLEAARALELEPNDQQLKVALRRAHLPRTPRIVSFSSEWVLDSFYITGVVTNDGSVSASGITVIGESFDEKQALVGTGQSLVEPMNLAPGDSGTFRVLVKGNPSLGKRYRARVAE